MYPSFNTGNANNMRDISEAASLHTPPGYYATVNVDGSITLTKCPAGHWCRIDTASGSEMNNVCGGNDRFCPSGSVAPTLVSIGHYTTGGTPITRHDEMLCEPGKWCVNGTKRTCTAGRYGSEFGMTSYMCSGECAEGFYCHNASISPRQFPCSDPSVFCVAGASEPTAVKVGYYSVGGTSTTRTGEAIAEVGHYAGEREHMNPEGRAL